MSRPRTPARLPPLSPLSPAPSPFGSTVDTTPGERAEYIASTMNHVHDSAKGSLSAAVQSLHDLASKLEEKVSDEIGTLRSSSHAITRQLSKQLQESQDRYIASELVVQVRDREIAQRIKAEAELNRSIERLQHALQREGEERRKAEATLKQEKSSRTAEANTREKQHTAALQDLAKSHALAVDQFQKESTLERTRATAELVAAKTELQSRVDDLNARLQSAQTATDELQQQHTALSDQFKGLQEEMKAEMTKGADAAAAHATEITRLKDEFSERTEELTLRLAAEHTAAESALRAEAVDATKRADARHAKLQAEHDACQRKLTLVEATNIQLQNDLKQEMRKSAAAEKQHGEALRAAMSDAVSSLEVAKDKINQANVQSATQLKVEFAQESRKYEDRLADCARKEKELIKEHEILLADARRQTSQVQVKLEESDATLNQLQEDYKKELRKHAAEIKAASDAGSKEKMEHTKIVDELQATLIAKYRAEVDALKNEHAEEMAKQSTEAKAQIKELKSQVSAKEDLVLKTIDKHKEEVTILRHEHSKEVTALKEESASAERELKSQHQIALSAVEDKLNRASAEHASRSERLRTEFNETMERLTASATSRERELAASHERSLRELQVQHAEAKGTYEAQIAAFREQIKFVEASSQEQLKTLDATSKEQLKTMELTLKQQIESLENKLRAADAAATRTQEETYSELRRRDASDKLKDEEIASLRDDLSRAAQTGVGTNAELVNTQRMLSDSEKQLAAAQAEVKALNARCDDLAADKSLADRASRLAADDVSVHLGEIKNLKQNHENELLKQSKQFEAAMEEQRAEYEAAIEKQVNEYHKLHQKAKADATELDELYKTKGGKKLRASMVASRGGSKPK